MEQDSLKSLLRYDPESGLFFWLVDRPGIIKSGDVAGTVISGRVYVRFMGRQQQAHRLAFLYMTGSFPIDEVDHRDGNPINNSWGNLRECTHGQNAQNKKVSKRNKSGYLGVSKHKSGWQATIAVDKKYYHLGLFKTPEEAHSAYLDAKLRLHTFNPKPREGSEKCKVN